MRVIGANESAPNSFDRAVLLTGRDDGTWRARALELLRAAGYDGVVFNAGATSQVNWEKECLQLADGVLCWYPPEADLFAPAARLALDATGRTIVGPSAEPSTDADGRARLPASLEDAVTALLRLVGAGALRKDGERYVPLPVWRTTAFQTWYLAQRDAGNRLDRAGLEWVLRLGPGSQHVFAFALRVELWVAAEGRTKSNETLLARPDVSSVLAFLRSRRLEDSEVVLVREFRSTATTTDGYVWELPSGSTFSGAAPLDVAVQELREETGCAIDATRLQQVGRRQLVSTFSTHGAHLFVVELTAEEMERFRQEAGRDHGDGSSERTRVFVRRVGDLLTDARVDWSCMGMILTALSRPEGVVL